MGQDRGPAQVVHQPGPRELESTAPFPHLEVLRARRWPLREALQGLLLLRFHRFRFPPSCHTPTIGSLSFWLKVEHSSSLTRHPSCSVTTVGGLWPQPRTSCGSRQSETFITAAPRPQARCIHSSRRSATAPTYWSSAGISQTTACPKRRARSRASSPR